MVTHIPSPSGSSLSLPLSPDSSGSPSTHRPVYASSQAGSSTASHTRRPSTSSVSSSSSHATLTPQPARNATGHPAHTRSVAGYPSAPSAYRAPSVASTSAVRTPRHERHARRTRSRRSVEVEPPPLAQNAFPWFGQTGDVEIYLRDRRRRTERRYLLHRLILAQNADWFEEDTRPAPRSGGGVLLGGAGATGPTTALRRIRYELDWSSFFDEHERIPLLVQTAVSAQASSAVSRPPFVPTDNKPTAPTSSSLRDLASGQARQAGASSEDVDVLAAYENLFLSFYNHAPTLSTTNIATAYVDSKLLLQLASAYSAIDAVGPRIDHHLLRFGTRLWKQIAKYPPSYLKLGFLARSKAIFSEALVHVVGMWPVGQPQLRRGLPGVDDRVVDVIEDKFDELERTKARAEAKLLRLSLTTGRGERVGPANGYIDWLALSLFRQWVADNTAPPQTSILKDGSRALAQPETSARLARAYRKLAAGGQGYLAHDDCKRFLKLRPADYSRENLRRLERRIDELKNLAGEAVRPLARHWLQLEDGGGAEGVAMGYLTCARCEERDFDYIWRPT